MQQLRRLLVSSRVLALVALLCAATVVAAGCGQFGERSTTIKDPNTNVDTGAGADTPQQQVSIPPEVADAADNAGCTTETPELQEPDHIGEGRKLSLTPNKYSSDPPTSGEHFGLTGAWGIYDSQLQDEYAVHNLEHGGVVIWTGEVARWRDSLEPMLRKQPKVVVSPREGLDDGEIVTTIWGAIMRCDGEPGTVEPALEAWIDEMTSTALTNEAQAPAVIAGTRPDTRESAPEGFAELPEPPEPVLNTSQPN